MTGLDGLSIIAIILAAVLIIALFTEPGRA
jgi:hypothetical protein